MTDRGGKGRTNSRLSLSKNKRNVSVTKTTITSLFNTQPPPELACPLCGQMVPRFKINQHIDVQCQNFEREDNVVASGSLQLSPKKDQETHQVVEEEERGIRETKTSPYFKKSLSQLPHKETSSKTAVRTINLGSLSTKLSKRYDRTPERDSTVEELGNSQKENVVVNRAEDKLDHSLSSSDDKRAEEKHFLELKHSKCDGIASSNPKLFKRKKEESPVLQKKSKYEGVEDAQDMFDETSTHLDLCNSELASTSSVKKSPVAIKESVSESTAPSVPNEMSSPLQLPYYLHNFHTVVHAVLENEDDQGLFNQDDMKVINTFEKLSVMGQKLYVRLFQRKLKWLQINKLDYGEICSNLQPVAQELAQNGFLQTEEDLEDVEEALDLLLAPELKTLAKTFHLGSGGTQKQQLVDGLLRLSKQKSLFTMASAQNNIGKVILKRAKQLAGSCVRLSRGPRAVFSRVLLLFSLTDTMDEEETAAGGQNQLFTILLVNSGRLAFPEYTVQREAKVFQDREDLIRYESAMRALQEITAAMQGGHWEAALDLYSSAKSTWQELRETHNFSHHKELAVFLRSFTTGWAYTRILSRGVEILQRHRRYEEAVEELHSLLQQSAYCLDSRGRWWDRLALNLHQHLKKPEEAISAIRSGLSDPLVRTGHKLSLHQRALRMKESPSCKKFRLQLKALPNVDVQDVKHMTIRGQLFPHEGGTGKSRFLLPVSEEEGDENAHTTVICSVEELCLAHYRKQGFDQGIHGEGSTFSTLFGLLMWDIIFAEGIADVFRNPYQTCPLDLYTDCFYESRKEAIACRVQLLREASAETLSNMLENVWTLQEGKVCSLVNWERFSSLQQAQSLVVCLSGPFLAGIIDRMARDYRHCRGGLPDLVVWNTSNNMYKLVEVKGPNDRLSQKQQIWLDELQKLGADVEVCHVTATGAKGTHLE